MFGVPPDDAEGESSGQLGNGSLLGVEPFPPHSDIIPLLLLLLLPFEVPRSLFGTRGGTTTSSPGLQVVSPSTQHIPTTVIMSFRARRPEPSIAEDAGRMGSSRGLAVWPLVSGRVACCASVSWFEPIFRWG